MREDPLTVVTWTLEPVEGALRLFLMRTTMLMLPMFMLPA